MKSKHTTPTDDPETYGPSSRTVWIVSGVVALIVLALILHRFRGEADHSDHGEEHGKTQWYISGMHPWIIQPEPGYCPVCGMELTPLRPEMLTGTLNIDPLLVQNIGVRITTARHEPFEDELRIFATVEYAEDTLTRVTTRSAVYVEKLNANRTEMPVKVGETLAEVHSPEVHAAAREWLELNRRGAATSASEAARSRLRILGVPESTIEAWAETDEVTWTYPVSAPSDGIVTALSVREGNFLPAGGVLLTTAALDPLWLDFALSPRQLPRLRPGMKGELQGSNGRGSHEVVIDAIYPTIDPQSRLGRGRVILPNPEGDLRLGAFHTLVLQERDEDPVVLVPREAVLSTGTRHLAYISLGDGRFEPREVRPGRESARGDLEILQGIEPGEAVVVSGQFLIDSESRLRENLLKLVEGDQAAAQRVVTDDAAETIAALPREFDRALAAWLEAYLELTRELVADRDGKVEELAATLGERGETLAAAHADHREALGDWESLIEDLRERTASLQEARSLRRARIALRELNDPLRELIHASGVPQTLGMTLHEVRCPMFPEMGQNAWWLQPDTSTENPYMGPAMLTCADQRNPLPIAGEAAVPEEEPAAEEAKTDEEQEAEARSYDHAFSAYLAAYLELVTILANDTIEGIGDPVEAMPEALARAIDEGLPGDAHAFHRSEYTEAIREATGALTSPEDPENIESYRMILRDLGDPLTAFLLEHGHPAETGALIAARCPMYPEFGDNAWWIQPEGTLANPFWGDRMLECADKEETLEAIER